ncbi:MAG TPA: hypothetical protein VFQ92_04445 [Blastocatellia bacterium]|nr:hypothetical protein [Blastocatellia bacterium]
MKRGWRRAFCAVWILAVAAMTAMVGEAQEISPEERLVKLTYARLMLYNKAANIKVSSDNNMQRQAVDDIRFQISNLHTGPIEEIYNKPYGSLVSKPVGEIIEVTPITISVNNGVERVMYRARWVMSQYASTEDWENTTVKQALDTVGSNMSDVGKYASYEVTVSLAGKERTYLAMVLYHGPLQSTKQPRVEFLDNIVDQTALTRAYYEQRDPARIIDPVTPPEQAVIRFESSGSDQASLSEENLGQETGADDLPADSLYKRVAPNLIIPGMFCDSRTGMCCDWVTMECCFPFDPGNAICDELTCGFPECREPVDGGGGGGEGEQTCASNIVRGTPRTKYRSDTQGHEFPGFGHHDVESKLKSQCVYESNCDLTCRVFDAYVRPSENGIPSSLCHKSSTSVSYNDSTGNNTSISCSATVGAAFKACLFCLCTVEISVGPLGVSSDGFWTYEHTLSHTCPAPTRQ